MEGRPCICELPDKNIVITSPVDEASQILLKQAILNAPGYQVDEWANTNGQLQTLRKGETRMIRQSAVSSLVRHLMAIERSRLLGSGAADISRYVREQRTQRWRESRKRFI